MKHIGLKKGRFYLGCNLHVRTDSEGYFDEIAITAANMHDSQVLLPILKEIKPSVRMLADKGYTSTKNRKLLNNQNLKDGIMNKSSSNKALDHHEIK